ncbi:AMP-binding protein [Paracoccus sp. Z330]|uniref:AMP-binding protein n=1 Tax=Paracoccus onchidii TaxID=3017813 RepID=A0ABT4ZAM5_9RHOB|nr:AMP-binding protein [Paracoccus onchidii]MDB6176413.1 AMP-binding protein [Paracoccus onchidii]
MSVSEQARTRPSYQHAAGNFRIQEAIAGLQGDLQDGLNACVECCDRHTGSNRTALRCLDGEENLTEYSFEQLKDLSGRVANLFASLGVKPGDVVAGLLPRKIDLVAVILGTWRLGAVYQPLFTAFGPKAIEHRLTTSEASLIVTDHANRAKLDDISHCPAIVTVASEGEHVAEADTDFRSGIAAQSPDFAPVMRRGDDLMMMMSTSGTTGLPKGVPVPLHALLSFAAYMRDAVDLRDDDVFWNIADPGWAYGLYYALTGPLLLGQATTLFEGGFTADSTYRIIDKLGVTSLAGSPTAFRLLIAAGDAAAAGAKGRLRVVSSAGEPLNPEIIRWFAASLDAPIHDHYGQTELGMCVNNHHGLDHPVRAGSAGLAMPGYRIAVLDDEGNEFEPDASISFIGRSDDVITSSGYRIGPFDVESALIEHPAVTEAAVVGVPDPQRTEIVKAFVILGNGHMAGQELAEQLQQHVRKRLSAHAYPREIEFVAELPKTPSGKIQRFILRKAEIAKQQQS